MTPKCLTAAVLSLAIVAFVCTAALGAEQHDDHAADEQHAAHGGAHDHIGMANAGEMVEKPQEVRSDLAIATFVVFLVLLAILWRFAWGPIVQALERREEAVAEHIAQAERSHEQAKLLLAQYERKLADAAGEVRELLEEARRDAEHTKQEILAEAKAAAEAERARALRDIDTAADAAMESLAERSTELAIELAGKIVHAQLSKDDHARLIQDAMAKFPSAPASNN